MAGCAATGVQLVGQRVDDGFELGADVLGVSPRDVLGVADVRSPAYCMRQTRIRTDSGPALQLIGLLTKRPVRTQCGKGSHVTLDPRHRSCA